VAGLHLEALPLPDQVPAGLDRHPRQRRAVGSKGRVGCFITMDGLLEDAKADKTLFRKIYLTFRPR
jgi:hypothetical protein